MLLKCKYLMAIYLMTIASNGVRDTVIKTSTDNTSTYLDHENLQDDLARFKYLTMRVRIAWPTLALLVISMSVFFAASAAYLLGYINLTLAICLNALASFWSFTVGHDASHNAVSTIKPLNDWAGRISTVFLSPIPFFRMFRFVHMQHHRFANDEQKDPDSYCGKGKAWTLPLRWASLDLHYFTIYLKPSVFKARPKAEQKEFFIATSFGLALVAIILMSSWAWEYFLLFLVPTRIAVVMLAFAFDYLPHYPHNEKTVDNPYQATQNRVGYEWLLTPVMLSQNYHLVHHLYPTVPFYRYVSVWRAKAKSHYANQPAITSAFRLSSK